MEGSLALPVNKTRVVFKCKRPPITYGAVAGNALNGGGGGRSRRRGRRFDWCLPVMRQQGRQVFVQ